MTDLGSARRFQFVGGNLSLDFCNTMGGKRGGTTRDLLGSCFDYIAWAFQAGLLDRTQAQRCLARAEAQPKEAELALDRAIHLREALFRIFAAIMHRKAPPRSDLAILNSELAQALGRLRLKKSNDQGAFAWQWTVQDGALEQPLGPIAHEAAKLLTDQHALSHLRMCNGDNCGWLFNDSSKNHSRRWCDMRDCGNRAKVRRHRLKQQREEATS